MRTGCTCDRIAPGKHIAESECPHCWFFHHVPKFNLKHGGDGLTHPRPTEPPAKRPPKPKGVAAKPLPVLDVCPWEGAVVSACLTCNSEMNHERQCGHPTADRDKCTRGNPRSTLQRCDTCTDRPHKERPAGWSTSAAVVKSHQQAAESFRQSIPAFPERRYSGRGIVIAAGGKYWASAYVTIRMLRHVGCTLPIQVWYLGASGERDERYERLLTPFGVEFVDIDTHSARKSRRVVQGFGTKLFAVVNSPFAEVLSLDPDCYPCSDPTVLFDAPEYRRLGGIYWPDGAHTAAWTHWDFWGVAKRGPCGLETGLYILDKRLAWGPMLLAEWYDDHPDWCYGGAGGTGGGDYGDKGPHRAAWAAFARDYVVFNPACGYQPNLGFLQEGPDGATMFVHRCHSKFSADGQLKFPTTPQHGTNTRHGAPGEDAAFGFLAELRANLG